MYIFGTELTGEEFHSNQGKAELSSMAFFLKVVTAIVNAFDFLRKPSASSSYSYYLDVKNTYPSTYLVGTKNHSEKNMI